MPYRTRLQILIILFTYLSPLYSIENSSYFCYIESVNRDNGLSHSEVKSVTKDSHGFLWFGTDNGLNKYNAYDCQLKTLLDKQQMIFSIHEDKNHNLWSGISNLGIYRISLKSGRERLYKIKKEIGSSSLHFYDIVQDHNNKLWFASSNGLYHYNEKTDSIEQFTKIPILNNKTIHCVKVDQENNLWLGTKDHGIFKLDNSTASNYLQSITLPTIYELNIDRKGIWASSFGGGLYFMDFKTEKIDSFRVLNKKTGSVENLINDFINWDDNKFLLATYNGLIVFNKKTHTFSAFESNSFISHYPLKIPIFSLYLDDVNMLWAATKGHGVYKFYLNNKVFQTIYLHQDIKSPENEIHCMAKTEKDTYLFGTESGLIVTDNRFNRLHKSQTRSGDFQPIITKIEKIKSDLFIIGTWQSGLFKYIPSQKQLSRLNKCIPENINVYDVLYDGKYIWVGMHEKGILKLDREFQIINHLKKYDNSSENKSIKKLFLDDSGRLWLGSQAEGIEVINTKSNKRCKEFYKQINGEWLPNLDILCLFQDNQKNIWIGTNGSGLYLYDKKSRRFIHLNREKNITKDVIFSVTQDENGFIWIQSNTGISRYNYYSNDTLYSPIISNYSLKEGLSNNNFFFGHCYQENINHLYFPSKEGMIKLNTCDVQNGIKPPRVVITDFSIDGTSFDEFDDHSIKHFPDSINNLTNINRFEMDYSKNRFTISFAALSYYNSSANQYMVKLEGIDNEWSSLRANRTISYLNLNPGTYTLKILASNNLNIWNKEGKELKIKIHPPWYSSRLSIAIYIIFVSVLLWILRQIIIKRAIHENERKMALFKLDFFTKLTHEIRTPITLIHGPLEKLLQDNNHNKITQRYLSIIKSNSDKLLNLTNQILDLRKVDEDKMRLSMINADIIPFINHLINRFRPFAETKRIDLIFQPLKKTLYWTFDPKIIDRILSNLLSNSIKFTPENGQVCIHLRTDGLNEDYELILSVLDNGIGINPKDLEMIFNPFYQVEKSNSKSRPQGTGIGLSLVKELTELHHGQVGVQSQPNKGTVFNLKFKIKDNHTIASPDFDTYKNNKKSDLHFITATNQGKAKSILIVEDNLELNEFLISLFIDDYKVYSATNGSDGYQIALKHVPDIIISDLMMPELDGNELCETLKSNQLTCHIPVIILTIKSNEIHQLESLSKGADDYIHKPFNPELLLIKVKNTLLLKDQLNNQLMKNLFIHDELSKDHIDPILSRTVEYIENHLDEVSIDRLLREIGIGRSQFYIKIKKISGMSVNELIQSIRLRNAYRYLTTKDYNVSEVAYLVGFKNLSHFSKSFKLKFGKTPSEISDGIIANKEL